MANHMKKKKLNLDTRVNAFQKKIGFKFENEKHLISALTHTSLFYQNQTPGTPIFERLEFFGDAVVNLAICEKLYITFPNANEGMLSKFRSTLVSKKILSLIARKLGIPKFVMMVPLEPGRDNQNNTKLFSDVLEALIGAIYLDQGYPRVRQFVWTHWKTYLSEKKISKLDPNPKSSLQEITQKIFRALPIYQTKSAKTGFSARVSIQKNLTAKGIGPSKQEAEADAAGVLLKKLRGRKTYLPFFKPVKKAKI